MKRFFAVCMLFMLLPACGHRQNEMDEALRFRKTLLQAQGCAFSCGISADYSNEIYEFEVECTSDQEGNITFVVTAPESISGIKGQLSASGGRLTFDDTVLGFPLLADGMLSPVSAPWILMRSLRNGYMTSCGRDAEGMRLNVNDSYDEDALMLEIWLDKILTPRYAEIFWKGKRILTIQIENFEML